MNIENTNRKLLKDKIEELIKLKISNRRFDVLLKNYNNFEYPLSERITKTLNDPKNFCVYILKDSLHNLIKETNV